MIDKLTPEELDAIEARCEAATPGPWVLRVPDWGMAHAIYSRGDCIGDFRGHFGEGEDLSNMKFAAHSREDIPRLVTALRAAYEEVEEFKDKLYEAENKYAW